MPEWRGEGAWDEEPSRGERAKEEAGGEVRARAGPGGAGRGAQGRRAEVLLVHRPTAARSCGSVHVHARDAVTLQQNHVIQTWRALATVFLENS